MTEEEAERKKASEPEQRQHSTENPLSAVDGPASTRRSRSHSDHLPRSPVDKTMEKAQKQADKSERKGANEQAMPERVLGAVRSPSAERTHGQTGSTLPVVEEAGEAGSTGGRSNSSVGRTAVDERERGRSKDEDANTGGIRRVISGEHTAESEKADGALDAPKLPPLTMSPALMDPEKSLVGGLERPRDLDLRHTV
jgi:hypothetical protein